jgi:hypothetical protein
MENITPDFLLKSLIRHFPQLPNIKLNHNKNPIEYSLRNFDKIFSHVFNMILFIQLIIHVLFHYMIVILT